MSEACGPSAELHGMEVHEVEDVLYVDILQLGKQCVSGFLGGTSVDDDVLILMLHGQMVDS